ncbi:hypothetical protein [Streptomyces cadmiisoli]|uniref:hypothetical protein n=1 Tax=Streptomyces cadmiisoli TaxID=2184053 RepID=UPI001FE7E3BA|nr:hypothetical protein [Streptomyces cadmiisoli]
MVLARVRDRARVSCGRNQHRRDTGVMAAEEVAELLAHARVTLAGTTAGPARPSRAEDFCRYLLIFSFSSDARIHLVRQAAG